MCLMYLLVVHIDECADLGMQLAVRGVLVFLHNVSFSVLYPMLDLYSTSEPHTAITVAQIKVWFMKTCLTNST